MKSDVQKICDQATAEWIVDALHTIKRGVCDKLTKDNVTMYKVKNVIRIDIKESVIK